VVYVPVQYDGQSTTERVVYVPVQYDGQSTTERVVYVPVQYDGQSTTNVWSMYRYSMMVSLQRMCGLCTGTV
jgi:allophanate hydrolase subunit 1